MAKNESDSQDITQSTKKVVIKTIKNTFHITYNSGGIN